MFVNLRDRQQLGFHGAPLKHPQAREQAAGGFVEAVEGELEGGDEFGEGGVGVGGAGLLGGGEEALEAGAQFGHGAGFELRGEDADGEGMETHLREQVYEFLSRRQGDRGRGRELHQLGEPFQARRRACGDFPSPPRKCADERRSSPRDTGDG